MAPHGIDWFTSQAFTRTGLADLPAHLQQHYGIAVADVTELDIGVYRVIRADSPDWVARVFPAARPTSAAESDARVLKALATAGFPAERCAAECPVSVLAGQPVLVTEFVAGDRPRANGRPKSTPSDQTGIARLDEALEAAAATTTGLPESFVHPTWSPSTSSPPRPPPLVPGLHPLVRRRP